MRLAVSPLEVEFHDVTITLVAEVEERRLVDAPRDVADAAVGEEAVHAGRVRAAEVAAEPGAGKTIIRVAPVVAAGVAVAGGNPNPRKGVPDRIGEGRPIPN